MKKSTLNIEWPTTHFTIQDIQNKYPSAKNITIRFRINRAIEENKIAYIGKNATSVGRPTIVFAPCPLEDSVLQNAVSAGVILDESLQDKIVKVAKVQNTPATEESVEEPKVVESTEKSIVE